MDAKDFDIFAMQQGTTFPEDSVKVYYDSATAYEIAQLDKQLNSPARYGDDFDEEAVIAKRRELKDKLDRSCVTIHMRGVPERKIQELRTEMDSKFGEGVFPPERNELFVQGLVALHLQKAVNFDGAEQDLSKANPEEVAVWFMGLPSESQTRLIDLTQKLSVDSRYFEQAEINSDF